MEMKMDRHDSQKRNKHSLKISLVNLNKPAEKIWIFQNRKYGKTQFSLQNAEICTGAFRTHSETSMMNIFAKIVNG